MYHEVLCAQREAILLRQFLDVEIRCNKVISQSTVSFTCARWFTCRIRKQHEQDRGG